MPFLQLTLHCSESEQPRFERVLEDLGALAVTLSDANADAADEQAIFEPGVGEQPLWPQLQLVALFAAGTRQDALLHAMEALDPELDLAAAAFTEVADQDWERAWMDQYAPLQFGRRTWIVPWNHDLPAAAQGADAAVLRLDPGLAFGSGTHPTTALCLEWLDGLALDGCEVLDFGCGSGILALAALRLGAAHAVGTDNDPQALIATRDNAERNGLAQGLTVCEPAALPDRCYAVVVANILASALLSLAPQLAAQVAPGGRIALSGILAGQEQELLARYAEWFDELRCAQREDWLRIEGVRRTQ
jgi:ribosomal protein L11 methyltransferase